MDSRKADVPQRAVSHPGNRGMARQSSITFAPVMKKVMIPLLLVLAAPALAQTQESLDSVVVRENRIQLPAARQNRNLQILTAAQIQQLPVKSTTELMSYLAGIDLRQRGPWGAQADIGLDGSTFDQVLVLINGVRMSDPQTGHHMMDLTIPLAAIDHIEVLHGPAASAYGVNALAGAINIVTKTPAESNLGVQVMAGSSLKKSEEKDQLFTNGGAMAWGSWKTKNTGQLLSVSHDRGNGYAYNTAFNNTRLYYQGNTKINESNELSWMGGYLYNDFGASLFYAAPNDKEAIETTQTALGSVSWKSKVNQRLTLTPRVSYRYHKDDYIYTRLKPEAYHNIHETGVATAELQGSYQMKSGIAGAGVEYRQEDIHSNNLGRHTRTNTGAYGEYRHFWEGGLSLGGGVYLNQNSDWGVQVFPSLHAGCQINPEWKVFANAGTGQRLPTYTDLYYEGPTNIGNADLKPEEAKYAELGWKYRKGALEAQATGFYRHINNYIDWVRSNQSAPWQPQNFQTVNTSGASLLLHTDFTNLLQLPGGYALSLDANYTYLANGMATGIEELPGAESKFQINALKHQLTAGLNARLAHYFSASVQCRFLERDGEIRNKYELLDLRLSWQRETVRIFADVTNLLDQQYQESGAVPMPGRWMSLGLAWQLKK